MKNSAGAGKSPRGWPSPFIFPLDLFLLFNLKQLDVKLDCDDPGLGLQQLECPRDGASPLLAASEDLTHPDLRPTQELWRGNI